MTHINWCLRRGLVVSVLVNKRRHVLGTIEFRLRFGGVLRGRFVPRTWFDRVPAGTVLAGTQLFRTRSDYKKWCVPRTCSENMFHVPAGTVPRTSVNARYICVLVLGGRRGSYSTLGIPKEFLYLLGIPYKCTYCWIGPQN